MAILKFLRAEIGKKKVKCVSPQVYKVSRKDPRFQMQIIREMFNLDVQPENLI